MMIISEDKYGDAVQRAEDAEEQLRAAHEEIAQLRGGLNGEMVEGTWCRACKHGLDVGGHKTVCEMRVPCYGFAVRSEVRHDDQDER